MTPMCTECVTDRTHNPSHGDGTDYDARWLVIVEYPETDVVTVDTLCNYHMANVHDAAEHPAAPFVVAYKCPLDVTTFRLHLR
jgi:hypothetical protein